MKKHVGTHWVLYGCLLFSLLAAMCLGSSGVYTEALHPKHMLFDMRASRVVLGFFAGAGLAACGVALQALYRNPLAEPYTLGVSGGAALGGVLCIVCGYTHPYAVPLGAFVAAAATTWGTYLCAQRVGFRGNMETVLLGVLFNMFAASVITWVKTAVSATQAQQILYWLTGSIGSEPWGTVLAIAGVSCVSYLVLQQHTHALNMFALGEDRARTLGVSVQRMHTHVLLATSLWIGTLVSFCGMVSFVGLVVPYIARTLWDRPVHTCFFPSTLLGGICVVWADTFSRLSLGWLGTEIPVGAITSAVGVPCAIALLWPRGLAR